MKLAATVIALVLCSAAQALGNVTAYEDLPFSSVQHIETCGSWDSGTQTGHFRVIRVYLYGQDMLFVDMVTLNDDQTRWIVAKGFTISEFNNDHADASLSRLRCKSNGVNNIAIRGVAETSQEQFRFQLGVDGTRLQYSFKKLN